MNQDERRLTIMVENLIQHQRKMEEELKGVQIALKVNNMKIDDVQKNIMDFGKVTSEKGNSSPQAGNDDEVTPKKRGRSRKKSQLDKVKEEWGKVKR